MTADALAVPCPCGGHVLHLSPDKPPVGARAAFTCPACGQRRTFVRTAAGAVFDGPEQPESSAALEHEPTPRATAPSVADVSPAPAAAPLPEPRPMPPGVLVVMTGLPDGLDPAWEKAINGAFPAPDWQVLPAAGEARQIEADVRFHRPAAVAVGDCPAGATLLEAASALPGRVREAMTVVWLGDLPEGDPLAAFRVRADATLAAADTAEAEARLTRAISRRLAQHSLFAAS